MSATLASPPEVSLPAPARLRALLLGLLIAALALGAVSAIGLLIVTGSLHTSLGSIG